MENIENSKTMKFINDLCAVIEKMMFGAMCVLGPIIVIEQIVIAVTNLLK